MDKHTPGPWEEHPIDSTAIQVRAGGAVVAEVATASYYTRLSAEQVANARLIAAAPELLEALEGLLSALDRQMTDPDRLFRSKTAARAVAAKAKGGAP